MPDARSLLLFVLAGLALNVTPGPDMLYIAARSTAEGRRAGIVSALGIGAGTLVHIAALALGLSALMRAVPLAYEIIRWTGAAYLAHDAPHSWAAALESSSLDSVYALPLVTDDG